MQDRGSKSPHVGLTMTTLTKVQMTSLMNTMSICQEKELNMVERNACNYFLPTWKPTSRAMPTKVSQTTSWVPMHSLP